MIEYDLVWEDSRVELIEAVNKKLREGWRLQGGASVAVTAMHQRVYIQAMIRDTGECP